MPNRTTSQSDKRAAKAAKAIQRAIRKDNPAKESPTVGKPVINRAAGRGEARRQGLRSTQS